MIIEAMYDNGRLLLPNHLSFAHNRFKIKVELPDAEIINRSSVKVDMTQSNSGVGCVDDYPEEYLKFKMLRDKAFGKDYVHKQEESDDEIIHQHWIEKHA